MIISIFLINILIIFLIYNLKINIMNKIIRFELLLLINIFLTLLIFPINNYTISCNINIFSTYIFLITIIAIELTIIILYIQK